MITIAIIVIGFIIIFFVNYDFQLTDKLNTTSTVLWVIFFLNERIWFTSILHFNLERISYVEVKRNSINHGQQITDHRLNVVHCLL